MKLLHIDSSPLGTHSASRELTASIVDAWKRRHPNTEIVYRDLAAAPLAHWTPPSDAAEPGARISSGITDEFLAADVVVVGAPMYNFNIPSQLKAWIDRIAIPGKTFRYTASGPEGLARGKKIVIASSRGGFYSAGSGNAAFDFQEAYLRHVFGFLGVTDIEIVRAEGLAMGPQQAADSMRAAHEEIDGRLLEAA